MDGVLEERRRKNYAEKLRERTRQMLLNQLPEEPKPELSNFNTILISQESQ